MTNPKPLEVRSALALRQAAVALQFAAEGNIPDEVKACVPGDEYCPNFHSYEKDLLSHAFRNPPPVRSYCVPNVAREQPEAGDYTLRARLLLPTRLRFHTEGETLERHRRGIDALPVSLSFSRSDFLQSGRSILNVVVHIDQGLDGASFGEYELVCLSKLWTAADDSETWLVEHDDEGLWFEIGDQRMRVEQLASRYLGLSGGAPIGGCVQIVFSEADGGPVNCTTATGAAAVTTRELIDALNAIQQEDSPPPLPRLQPALNAVGCLLQNIFDMENVDLNELEDMLDGVNTSRSAVTAIHRNTLFAIAVNDRLFEDEAETIGMSPYLLLPQAALLHNERLLFAASELLRQTDRIEAALQVPQSRDEIRRRLVDAVRNEPLDDLPGGPDVLIRKTTGWLWRRYLSGQDKPTSHRHDVRTFVAELDLAVVEGLAAHARGELSRLIDRDMLGNIFQYSSERWIFEEGNRDRGLDSLLAVLRKRSDDLANVIEDTETRHNEWRNSNYAVIGLVFTLYTVIPFEGVVKRLPLTTDGDELGWFGLAMLMAVGFALIYGLLRSRIIALIYMRALGHVVRKIGHAALLPPAPAATTVIKEIP